MTRDFVYIEELPRFEDQTVRLKGWLYNKRVGKDLQFLVLRDGSGLCQCVVNKGSISPEGWLAAEEATQEAALQIDGRVRRDERQVGGYELEVHQLSLLSAAESYPITPKEHGIEFLMNHRHLWLRSRRQWAAMRVRNRIVTAIHNYFQELGFLQLDAPIFTGNAVEGTSTLFETDYFDDKAYLTQSGQLHGEAMAMAFGRIYTFGPTFRAEKSKTRRHLTEFWMIEPEMAFCDIDMNMEIAEGLISRIVADVLAQCAPELATLERDTEALQRVQAPFPRLSYSDAVDLLRSDESSRKVDALLETLQTEQADLTAERERDRAAYGQAKKHEKRRIDAREIEINARLAEIEEDLRNLPAWKASARSFQWGDDLGGSDETILTWHFDRPVIIHRYPAAIKAFYMKRDPEDDRLALGMDVLAPEGYGEIIGGGERATDLTFLENQVAAHGLPPEVFSWYFDLRRYGSVPHSGFGLGLERTVSWICKLKHVREAIPFPRLIGRLHP